MADASPSKSEARGRQFRILVVVEDYARKCLSLMADTSLSGARLTAT
jgi:hypothetical protein